MKKNINQFITNCKNLKLLYVEDNDDARFYTMQMLKRFFNDITMAVDGVDGVDKFKKSKFDLVLTDINMPNMGGLDMATEIRKIDNSITVLVLSAHNESEYFMKSIKLGIDGFLLKPIELNQFVDTVGKGIEKFHLKNEIKTYQEKLETSNHNLEQKVEDRTAELKYRFFHDHLTELGNHHALMEVIGQTSNNLLFLIDIHGFQKINDTYGLEAGNVILKRVAAILAEFNSEGHYSLYRVYGNGFAIYYHSNNDESVIFEEDKKRLLALFDTLNVYLAVIDQNIDIEVNIGTSSNEQHPLVKAEIALKHAKNTNTQLVDYTQKIDFSKKVTEDLYWNSEIKIALQNEDIVPVFQGIVDIYGHVVKYESLMRLRQHDGVKEKLISPYFFLDAAKNTQQYAKLTRIMVHKSFEKMKDLKVDFSINLTCEDLSDPLRVTFLHEQIVHYGVGSRLIIEILESEMFNNYEEMRKILEGFKKHGVTIAIDDFGSGFSSFEHILRLEPDYIKIDASLIKNILLDKKSFTLVKAIAQFSKELGIKVIAEHVSSKQIFDKLSTLSIDEYQGYYFSFPSQSLELTTEVG
jgi:diguanylate cyclase (GGDEF)-like protein